MTAADLAAELGADQRTLRRAIEDGTIRARRPSPRRLELRAGERDYLAQHWPTLQQLRRALRTEPNVTAAILFGSAARGDDRVSSDLDLLVSFRSDSAGAAAQLEERLSEALGREVQVTREGSTASVPRLALDVLAEGRPLVDRGRVWARLRRRRSEFDRAAAAQAEQRAQTLAAEYGLDLVA